MLEHNTIEQVRELKVITESRTFRSLMSERKEYAQREVNRYIREQNWTQAYAELAKMDDMDKLYKMAVDKLARITKGDV